MALYWKKIEFQKWTKLGIGITSFEGDTISNSWIKNYQGIPHRKLLTALQLRANVYPTREYLARGKKDGWITWCRHCKAENKSCAHIIGQCPAVEDARIKRYNYICEMLSGEARKKDWVVYQEPNIRDSDGELFKPDLVFVKEKQALGVDVTVRFEGEGNTLEKAAKEKVKKYQHLEKEIQELTNTEKVIFYIEI